MSTTLPPWDEAAYQAITGVKYGSLEGQYGSIPTGIFSQLRGTIIEIYPNGTYLFAVAHDDEILVTDSDPRLFEVDLP
jgi:hypothetical protein